MGSGAIYNCITALLSLPVEPAYPPRCKRSQRYAANVCRVVMDWLGGLFYLFAVVSTLYVTHIGFYLIGANFYDIWQYRRQLRRRNAGMGDYDQVHEATHSADSANTLKPLVTVAVPAHNEEKVIVRCLHSIRQCSYNCVQTI